MLFMPFPEKLGSFIRGGFRFVIGMGQGSETEGRHYLIWSGIGKLSCREW
jgi:hypothetical protein